MPRRGLSRKAALVSERSKRRGGRLLVWTAVVAFAGIPAMVWYGGRPSAQANGPCPIDMQYIPAGAFAMGSTQKAVDYLIRFCRNTLGNCDPGWFTAEMPQSRVTVRQFCMDTYEYPNGKGRYPASQVNVEEAERTCSVQGKRLCSQEEWERACSGTDGRAWSFGSKFDATACAINIDGITPAGSHPKCRSAFGVMDLNGNAAEWTKSGAGNVSGQDYNVVRGGSYRDGAIFTRCAFRDKFSVNAKYSQLGFRCCKDI